MPEQLFVKVNTLQVWVPSLFRVPSSGSSMTSVRSQESVLRTADLEPAPNCGLDLSSLQAEKRSVEPVFRISWNKYKHMNDFVYINQLWQSICLVQNNCEYSSLYIHYSCECA